MVPARLDVHAALKAVLGRWCGLLLVGLMLWAGASPIAWAQAPETVVLDRARFVSASADIGVSLPYRLQRHDFVAQGEAVRFFHDSGFTRAA